MTLIYTASIAALLYWLTWAAFLLLDGRLVARALSGRETASVDRGQGLLHRPTGMMWLSVAELAGLAAASIDALVLPWRWPLLVIGLGVAWFGLSVRWWAKRTLGRFFVGAVIIQSDHQVVRSGPYSLVRHPGYAAMILAFIGLGVATANALTIVILTAVPTIVVLRTLPIEETALTSALGADYRDYQRTTARLVPGVW